MKGGRPGDCHTLGTVARNPESCNVSAVLSGRLLCYAYADGPPLTVLSPLLTKVTKAHHVGGFAQCLP